LFINYQNAKIMPKWFKIDRPHGNADSLGEITEKDRENGMLRNMQRKYLI